MASDAQADNSRPDSGRKDRVAVVLKGYPRLSETFIAQEILALERAGMALELYSLRHPTDTKRHPVHEEIKAPVRYLPEYLKDEPLRVWRGWRRARKMAGYTAAFGAFWRDLKRDRTANRLRRFGQACVLAAELPPEIGRLYAHFLHTPASVARYAALMTGLPWCASAHAKDIWTTADWEKREKLDELDWLVTCTAYGCAHLRSLAAEPGKVGLVYHGLDLTRFAPPEPDRADETRDGSDPAAPVKLLSVGRAVEKKGYDDLLDALAALPGTLQWRLTHIGGGADSAKLRARADRLGLSGKIDWQGAQAQEAVLAAYRASDLFVLASKEAADGDRDGLPIVLMEAQSQGLACLTTAVSAIPELIDDGATGRLVPPGAPEALAAALEALIRDPAERARLAAAGQARVRRDFQMDRGIAALLERFRGADRIDRAAQ